MAHKDSENPYKDGIPEAKTPRKGGRIAWFLIILPIGIAFGTVWGLFQYFSGQEEIQQKASKKISRPEISQILDNWSNQLGPREFNSNKGMEQLSLAVKMLSGELQTNNSGLINRSDKGGYEENDRVWPTLWADVRGTNSDQVFFIATSYDGTKELRDSAKIALMITVAKSLAATPLDYTLRFVFTPKELPLAEQKQWIEKQCLSKGEKSIGIFLLAHDQNPDKEETRQDSWKASAGDAAWAAEILNGTRVMQYGVANLRHGVLKEGHAYSTNDAARVEAAAKGLRSILFIAMGGDR